MKLDIDDVVFHDAALVAIHIEWVNGTCIAELLHGTLGPCTLTFSSVSALYVPRRNDWGRSASVDTFSHVSGQPGQYEIAMQSGDVIRIEATAVVLTLTVQN